MRKRNGLIPLSILAIAGFVSVLRMIFWATGIHWTLTEYKYRALVGYLVPGVFTFLAATASLVVSSTWLVRKRYKSEAFGFAVSALAATTIIESIFWIIYGIVAMQ